MLDALYGLMNASKAKSYSLTPIMESLDLFLSTRTKCRAKSSSPLHLVAVDILDHKSETYLVLHDYHSAFLAVERINASRNEIENEGQEITELLAKYFMDIFDSKAKHLTSDTGHHRYTCHITNFCKTNMFDHYFPEFDEPPGISKITLKAIVNLFNECDENFVEVQIALGVLRDSGSKKNRSPAQILFYEEKELIVWDSDKYDKNFLEVTYAQLTLMKSKLDHRLLAITNALLKQNKNSINFKIDYPKLSLEIPTTTEAQIRSGFQNGFNKAYEMIKKDKLEKSLKLFNTSKNNSQDEKAQMELPEAEQVLHTATDEAPEAFIDVKEEELAEMWGEAKSAELKIRGLCSLCFAQMSPEHIKTCKGPEQVCFNCNCDGHNSKACLRKPKWSRKSLHSIQNPFPKLKLNKDIFLANQQELVRNGLKHVNFENLNGKEKRNALRSRGYCINCGNPSCTVGKSCRAQNSQCEKCGQIGHYSRICQQETEMKIDYMTDAAQNELPNSIMSMLIQK